jgi:hypothetical protein
MMTFPRVEGNNLEGRKFRFPGDFEGEINLVFIPFQRWHQEWVDTWVPLARRLVEKVPGLHYYELPTLPRMNPFYRMSLDYGMKMGIPDRAAREATITLYLDKEAYRKALDIPDEETVVTMLVTRGGEILWRTEGPFAVEEGEALVEAVNRYFAAKVQGRD